MVTGDTVTPGAPTWENRFVHLRRSIMAFTLPPLPYPADALEVAIDKMTMEIHHGKHHKAYVDNLNAALEGHADLQNKPIDQLMRDIAKGPDAIHPKVINNCVDHSNITRIWSVYY